MYIYKVVNKINGKIYVGQDSKGNPKYLGSGTNIIRAVSKYGRENFDKVILEQVTEDTLDARETFWINKLKSYDPIVGYNINREGGKPPKLADLPKKVQKQVRKKWKEQRTGVKHSQEYKQNHSRVMKELYKEKQHPTKGRTATNEEKLKKSKIAKERGFGGNMWDTYSEEKKQKIRAKMSKTRTGKKRSEETKKKISQTLKQLKSK